MNVVIYTILTAHVGIVLTSIYLHRYLIHRQYTINYPIVEHVFRFLFWITEGIYPKPFIAQHRIHHMFTEVHGDPHSPLLSGFWRVTGHCLIPNFFSTYRYWTPDWETEHFGRDAPDNWLEKNLYCHTRLGVLMLLLIDIGLFGWIGIVSWLVHMFAISLFVNATITGFGHKIGYRNYDRNDVSTNVLPWGILGCGEELHNNHHEFPRDANFAKKWFEFDLGYQYIKLLKLLGLIKINTQHKE